MNHLPQAALPEPAHKAKLPAIDAFLVVEDPLIERLEEIGQPGLRSLPWIRSDSATLIALDISRALFLGPDCAWSSSGPPPARFRLPVN